MKRYTLTTKALQGTAPAPALRRFKAPSKLARTALKLAIWGERACIAIGIAAALSLALLATLTPEHATLVLNLCASCA